MNYQVDMEYLSIILIVIIMAPIISYGEQSGYCQVYSYNINHRLSATFDRHFFVCCNNFDEKSCQGYTYQKPTRLESFCTGDVIQEEGSHWTQIESRTFPNQGRFYCGGCCGQHLAANACQNHQLNGDQKKGCTNWVQCFQRECKNIVAAVLSNQPLKCTLPPPPHPKHYWQNPRTVPANFSIMPTESSKQDLENDISTSTNKKDNATCSDTWCQSVRMEVKCRNECCQSQCCLPDGPQATDTNLIWGISPFQFTGIVLGSLLLLASLMASVFLLLKKYASGCHKFKLSNHDSQMLVIECPEEIDQHESDSDSN